MLSRRGGLGAWYRWGLDCWLDFWTRQTKNRYFLGGIWAFLSYSSHPSSFFDLIFLQHQQLSDFLIPLCSASNQADFLCFSLTSFPSSSPLPPLYSLANPFFPTSVANHPSSPHPLTLSRPRSSSSPVHFHLHPWLIIHQLSCISFFSEYSPLSLCVAHVFVCDQTHKAGA